MGWGILAAVLLAILGIFLVSRALTQSPPDASQPPSDAAVSAASSAAVSSAADSSEAPASAGSAAPSEAAAASSQPASSAPASSAPAVAIIEPDTMSQAERKDLLLRLIGQGVFTGVEALGTPPKVGVTALFRGLDTSLQEQFIAAAHAYVQAGTAQPVTLEVVDAQSGTTIGSYSAADGLKLQ
jgi:hypothetical protein